MCIEEKPAQGWLAAWRVVAPETVLRFAGLHAPTPLHTPQPSRPACCPRRAFPRCPSLRNTFTRYTAAAFALAPSFAASCAARRLLVSPVGRLWAVTTHHTLHTTRRHGLWRLLDDMHKGRDPAVRAGGPPGHQRRRGHPNKVLLADH